MFTQSKNMQRRSPIGSALSWVTLATWDPPIPPEDLDPAIPRPVPARGRFLSRPGLRIHEGSQQALVALASYQRQERPARHLASIHR